jgi:acyl-CoA thioesterase-1
MVFSLPGRRLYRRYFIATTLLAAASARAATNVIDPNRVSASSQSRTILVLGDSLSAEYGLKRGYGWVALLENRLTAEKLPFNVINASISGDTSAGGRSRLGALLKQHHPTHVIIELGANDALRGLALDVTKENLNQMTQSAQQTGAKVLLIGMQMPPNYGTDYSQRFAAVFSSVAKANQVALVPFLLKGIADAPDSLRLFQPDRIHPKEEAHPVMLANVWPQLRRLLQ